MRRRRRAALALAALLGACAAEAPQAPGPAAGAMPPEAAPIAQSSEVRAAVEGAFRHTMRELGCADARLDARREVRGWRPPPTLRAVRGGAVDLAWLESASLEGCDTTDRLTVLGTLAGGRLDGVVPAPPGHTLADPVLATDLLRRSLVPVSLATNPSCRAVRVVNTQLVQGPATPRAPWQENWVLDQCGRTVALPVSFEPLPEGVTRFTVRVPLRLPTA